jgi:hypothetical protein
MSNIQFSRHTDSTKSGRYYKLKGVILPELGDLPPADRLTRRGLDQYVNKRLSTQKTACTGPESKRVKKKPKLNVPNFFTFDNGIFL